MIRVMLDSDEPAAIVGMSPLVATYADLVTPALVKDASAAGSELVVVDRKQGDPHGLASVIDVEPGCWSPAEVTGWLAGKRKQGVSDLAVYADRTDMAEVDKLIKGHAPYRWYATLDGTAHVAGHPAGRGPAAIQVLGAADLGFHADLSLVFEDSFHPAVVGGNVVGLAQHVLTYLVQAQASVAHAHTDAMDLLTALGG